MEAQLQALNEAATAAAAGPSSPRGFTAGLTVSGSAASGGGAVRGARPRSAGAPQRRYGNGTTGGVVVQATPPAGYQHLRLTAGVGEQAADGGTACADARASPRSPSRMTGFAHEPGFGGGGGRGSGGGGGDLGGGEAGFIGARVNARPCP